MTLGQVTLALGGSGRGITGWHVAGAPGLSELLGIAEIGPLAPGPDVHPNGAIGVDHVVVLVPDFDATAAALEALGLPFRRVRQASETVRQGFRRLGPAILEVVEAPQARAPTLWGLVPVVADLDAVAAVAAPHVPPPRPAVQPGRQIVPVRSTAGLSTQLAFMDPEPAGSRSGSPADRS